MENKKDMEKECRLENGGFLTPHIFTFTIPKVDGGSSLSINVTWIQKLSYRNGEFSLNVPFSFPEYVTPAVKKLPKKERIQFNVNSGTGSEIVCKTTSHPLKQFKREAGKMGFLYEADVLTWTNVDFAVSYSVSSNHIFGGVILQSPSALDADQREMFCVYVSPGDEPSGKVFRKEIVFVVDISGSMEGKPLEGTKNSISGALAQLGSKDSFNIIAFNGETYLFSSSMELATEETVEKAVEWMNVNFIAGGSTNILLPLNQAMEMVSNTHASFPVIFLVTDGSVDNERHICDLMTNHLTGRGSICPRIYTFGIGTYCNHHFLCMLAMISRGQYDAAYSVDSVQSRLQKFFSKGLSPVLANITLDTFDDLDEVEVYPSRIPDLSSESLLIISGRYRGNFPENLKAKGALGDLSNFVIDLKIHKEKDMPFERIFAKQQIDLLTAQAWFSENKRLEEKVVKMSIQTGVFSEYTRLTLLETQRGNQATDSPSTRTLLHKGDSSKVDSQGRKRILLQNLGVGFGNLAATAENIPPGIEEPKLPEAAEIIIKAASNCCGRICSHCCCMCCIQCCSKINDQCAIVLTQFCAALACFGCLQCCSDLCCCGNEGQ
ncbi:inter-alpha-trypsin inhibitor heavy chain H3 isoform X2 [Jatropha curcas]|nr:inter-alpha-trypsin inhibitor heavy chain H3 isoform X2 [Jatropha curcas]